MTRGEGILHSNQVPRPGVLESLPVREDCLYTDSNGNESRGIRKHAEKALLKLRAPLLKLLGPDETILFVARANMPMGGFEQLTFGWYAYQLSGAEVVVTNRRLLFLLVKSNGDWRQSVRGVAWGDITEAQVKGWFRRTLLLKYRNGSKEKLWNIAGRDGKKLRHLLPQLVSESLADSTPAQGPASLCPECSGALQPRVYHCSGCGLIFKDEKTLVRRSLLIPGGGYFYCRQVFLGIGDMIGEGILLFWIALLALAVSGVMPLPAEPGEEPIEAAGFAVVLVFLLAVLAIEKWATIHHCRRFIREFIPTGEHASSTPTNATATGA